MLKVKEMPLFEQPRQKALAYGLRSLSSQELLALVLRNGIKGKPVFAIAGQLLESCKDLNGIAKLSVMELARFEGIGKAKALELMAGFEMARRMALNEVQQEVLMDNVDAIFRWLRLEIGVSNRENFLVIFLNTRLIMLSYKTFFSGTVDCAPVFPREIFKEALLRNACAIIVVHNHPAGSCKPSGLDIDLTRELQKASKFFQVRILDHIIVTAHSYYSFRNEGLMEESEKQC